ncbi:MAG: YidC/Oxa1 family membrane protein insertase [Treponema sp.]|nr:YidC/Oxa1 family membrane protein insertase [Treponema sp.]MBR1405281.1 YidC/Oxa1 family membrane protein insertase [Treponema sp.]
MGNIFFTLVIYPLTQIIELVFRFCDKLFDNTGIAILGVSFAVSMLTLPLYIVSEHWQQVERDTQIKMKPSVDRIKAVFKGNEQYMILSTFYAEKHYHPIMSLRSAFGLLIQIPFFTAAYTCLSNLTALQGEHFLFIRDMGGPDALFTIGSFNINVLPIAMTAINCIAGAIYTKGLALRDKLQVYGLALLFVVILYNSPAGLVLYWTMNNVFSLVKNIFYKLRHPVKTLYYILCSAVTVLILWLFIGNILSAKRALLVSAVFALVYFAPLYVAFFNFLIKHVLSELVADKNKRFALFSISTVGLTILLGLLIPTLLISSSPMEFSGIDSYSSPMFFVWNTFLQALGFCIVWPFLIYFLYKERIQALLAFVFSGLLFFSLCNTFIFQGDYGTLSKLLVFNTVPSVDSSLSAIIVNLIVLSVFAIVLLLIFRIKKAKIISTVTAFIVIALVGVSVTNIVTIKRGYAEYLEVTKNNESAKTIKPIFHFSKNAKNVLFIYLDRAENRFVEPIFAESPELYAQYDGFTLFKNTVSFNGHTLLGAPVCYGGYEYTPEQFNIKSNQLLSDKQNEALLLLPRIFSEQAGFSATVTDPSWANYSWVPDFSIYEPYPQINAYATEKTYLDQWYREHKETANFTITSEKLKRNILWFGFFRTSPLFLRPAFYNDGKYWSADTNTDDINDFLVSYSVMEYLPLLSDFSENEKGSYINIVSNQTHENIILQYPDYIPVSKVTNKGNGKYANDGGYHSNAAALKRIGEWFAILKENGVYDNTRIILVADHGRTNKEDDYKWDDKFKKIGPGHYHPLLLYKDFGSSGKLSINTDFMTNADVPTLLLNGIADNAINPFTGNAINKEESSKEKEKGALVCTSNIFMPYHTKSKYIFTTDDNDWWRVKDNIFDSSNWTQETHSYIK